MSGPVEGTTIATGFNSTNSFVQVMGDIIVTGQCSWQCNNRLAKDKLNISTKSIDGQEKDINSIVQEVYKYFSKRKSLYL
jgi:hypothetical protein